MVSHGFVTFAGVKLTISPSPRRPPTNRLAFQKDEDFVEQLASQMDALRGRELPGFMSAQSFYMFMAQYVEAWRDPARVAATEVG